jgi:hypothetical protein
VRQLLNPSFAQLWRFLAVALPALAALLVPMPAVDLAYQLRAGADIVAGRGIPAVDAWTFTVTGTPWLDQQWGAQALLAAVFQAGGWTGLAVLRAGLVAVAFGTLLVAVRSAWSVASLRAGGSATASSARTATLIVLLWFAVAAPALALRPQLFAMVLFIATLLVLVQRAEHPRRLWLIPVFAAAWANLHGSFPLVVVLVGLAWVDEVSLLREPLPAGHPRPPLPQRLLGSTGIALIGAISVLATLATPFGVDTWRYVANLAGNPEITSQVSEWRPPSPLDPAGAVFYVSLAVVLGMIVFRFRSDAGRPPARFVAPMLSVAAFGALGVVTGRGLAWWALAAPVAMVQLQPGLKLADVRVPGIPGLRLRARTAREASASESRRSPLNAILAALLILAGVALLPAWRPAGPSGVPVGVLSYAPAGAAIDYLRSDAGPGLHIWNPQSWGSWLELIAPEHQYAVDSRIELFPADLWSDVDRVRNASGDWRSILDRYGVDAVIVPADDAALDAALDGATGWSRAQADADATIWRRTKP